MNLIELKSVVLHAVSGHRALRRHLAVAGLSVHAGSHLLLRRVALRWGHAHAGPGRDHQLRLV